MYVCKKCGSVNLRMEYRGSQIGLYCNDCNSYIKWVSKKELTQVQNEIEKNAKELGSFKDNKDLTFEYEQVGKREMYHNIQRQIMSIDEDETLNDKQKYELLISVINNLGDALQDTEEVIGDTMKVFNSSEILMDIRLDSIDMQKQLINKYGRYA